MQNLNRSDEYKGRLLLETVTALSEAVDVKDRYTNGHSKRVGDYAKMLARALGKSEQEQEDILYAGLLHDVGKIRVPDDIINKSSGLTQQEYDYMKLHPVSGYHILKNISSNPLLAEAARFHHERYDGTGYPSGLAGEDIPEIGRIIAVADSYDAMASNRSYRSCMPQEDIIREMEKAKGTQLDPKIADIFIEMIKSDTEYTMRQPDVVEQKILVVDDEPMNIKLVEFILKDTEFCKVLSANSGYEALEVLGEQPIDLVLLDIEMPQMNGFETVEKINEKYNVPVVFMTAHKDMDMIRRAEALHVRDYLTKPFLPGILKEIVHSILGLV
ncbi:MAG: response regulator [bacterium]|nr:response regulator [bacterium]